MFLKNYQYSEQFENVLQQQFSELEFQTLFDKFKHLIDGDSVVVCGWIENIIQYLLNFEPKTLQISSQPNIFKFLIEDEKLFTLLFTLNVENKLPKITINFANCYNFATNYRFADNVFLEKTQSVLTNLIIKKNAKNNTSHNNTPHIALLWS